MEVVEVFFVSISAGFQYRLYNYRQMQDEQECGGGMVT